MIISGHQPVYLPWIGLIHKASLCDIFIFMDDVQYLKEDWNNRNKVKVAQGNGLWLTVPVDLKNSKSQLLKDILIVKEKGNPKKFWNQNHWNTLKASYGKCLFFKEYSTFFEWLYLEKTWEYLSDLNFELLKQIFIWFGIKAKIEIASKCNFTQHKSDLVLEHAKKFNAEIVVTGTHGKDYIDLNKFKENNVNVYFQDYQFPVYPQKFGPFLSHLSFVDLLFNCGPDSFQICLGNNITKNELIKMFGGKV